MSNKNKYQKPTMTEVKMKHQHLLNGDSDTDTGSDGGVNSRQYRSNWDDKE
jgi:hypothetical protein